MSVWAKQRQQIGLFCGHIGLVLQNIPLQMTGLDRSLARSRALSLSLYLSLFLPLSLPQSLSLSLSLSSSILSGLSLVCLSLPPSVSHTQRKPTTECHEQICTNNVALRETSTDSREQLRFKRGDKRMSRTDLHEQLRFERKKKQNITNGLA